MVRAEAGQTAADLKKQKALLEEEQEETTRRLLHVRERILSRALLKEHQTVPFHALDHALKEQDVSHAYLFTGPKGSLKKELAVLYAQSLLVGSTTGLVQEDQLSEEDQRICINAAEGIDPDFLILDGRKKEAVSKDAVDQIQLRFASTASGKTGTKIYLIDHAENMSVSAMNSLLKYLEEPGPNVLAVLTADNIERLLPTIISRCVNLQFNSMPESVYQKLADAEGLDREDSFLISRAVRMTVGFQEFAASESFQTAKSMLKEFIGAEGDCRQFLVDYDTRWRIRDKDAVSSARDRNLDTLKLFFAMLSGFYHDTALNDDSGPAWYYKEVQNAQKRKTDCGKRIRIAVEAMDRCNRNNDLNLVLDQAIYRMENTAE
ncbi:MAG: hypothetical protein LKF79_08335 [Solobacterium sp.]|jgi:DNA polymerase-3 subunit delta'|nr:hypothetical protein [Solobacterium sp.]MCH4266635.1 hypothetical protein [Solobacterium sp.]